MVSIGVVINLKWIPQNDYHFVKFFIFIFLFQFFSTSMPKHMQE